MYSFSLLLAEIVGFQFLDELRSIIIELKIYLLRCIYWTNNENFMSQLLMEIILVSALSSKPMLFYQMQSNILPSENGGGNQVDYLAHSHPLHFVQSAIHMEDSSSLNHKPVTFFHERRGREGSLSTPSSIKKIIHWGWMLYIQSDHGEAYVCSKERERWINLRESNKGRWACWKWPPHHLQ